MPTRNPCSRCAPPLESLAGSPASIFFAPSAISPSPPPLLPIVLGQSLVTTLNRPPLEQSLRLSGLSFTLCYAALLCVLHLIFIPLEPLKSPNNILLSPRASRDTCNNPRFATRLYHPGGINLQPLSPFPQSTRTLLSPHSLDDCIRVIRLSCAFGSGYCCS